MKILNKSYDTEEYYQSNYWEGREANDSDYKVELFKRFIRRHPDFIVNKTTFAEIGCGQGAFVFPFEKYLKTLKKEYKIYGYDISTYAIGIAKEKNTSDNIEFSIGSAAELSDGIDLVFVIDVLEHVENTYQFLRDIAIKTNNVIIYMPIESSVCHLFAGKQSASYKRFRHIHFFSWESAILLIEHSPFEIVDYQFTIPAHKLSDLNPSSMSYYVLALRKLFYKINERFANLLVGGHVMLMLRRKSEVAQL